MSLPEPVPARSLREKWLNYRNNLIASPRFQHWAGRFFITRPIARRNARALFDLVAGFVYSQTLAACVRLKLFELLQAGPLAVDEIARRVALPPDGATRLLKAAAALELTQGLPDGRYGLGPLGAALLGNPALAAMIEHHVLLYADLADPVALLRGDVAQPRLKTFWSYAKSPDAASAPPDSVRAYSALMAASQAMVAREVLDACPLGQYRRLMDVGGGEGAFLIAAGARYPRLELQLFDLPAVSSAAARRFADAGLGSRARVSGGDFFRDALPLGADIVSLVRVLHDHDDGFALALLQRIHAALPKGGTLLLAEPMAGTKGARASGDAYFGLYLAAMGSGRPRTWQEIASLLGQAGFSQVQQRFTATPLIVRVLTARA